ncbi:alpha/beta fold hydrolase [Croceicoccus sp. F390]|uniref:Alpha/beta fold hydrolase n=1 Tax=Croceicoccus esteveae TaxID=3075597 RepID=A0ABU2ZI64_9SPHN|nr:alpha/beta fold hydrolase [Croceicoccus sp. F390]MDT0576090.1 alpha/beta fold hydrolase [Croceicoccus sp. F390]
MSGAERATGTAPGAQELSFDVARDDGGTATITMALYLPEGTPSGVCFVCMPGGGASRHYFDLGEADGVELSFAALMTGQGHAVVTLDTPGTGTNALGDNHPFLMPRTAMRYVAQAATQLRKYLGDRARVLVGTGHSMGGALLMLCQGQHRAFDAMCIMGASAGGIERALDNHEKQFIDRPDALEAALPDLVERKFKTQFPSNDRGPSETSAIFGGQTPAANDLLRAAMGSFFAAGGYVSMVRGSIHKEAQRIDIPAFFMFGDRDIGIAPNQVLSDFPALTDATLLVLADTGHNHFAFRSIGPFTRRLDHWVRGIAHGALSG